MGPDNRRAEIESEEQSGTYVWDNEGDIWVSEGEVPGAEKEFGEAANDLCGRLLC
jgi:hypothetical protein